MIPIIIMRGQHIPRLGAGLVAAALATAGCTTADKAAAERKSGTVPVSQTSPQQPAEHRETGEPSVVHLDPERVEELGVEVGTPRLGNARQVVERPATVSFDLDRVAKVGPRIQAKVVRVMKDLGDRVRENEPLALMSSVELGRAKADYLAAVARLETDREAYEREKNLYADQISSEAELLEAKARYEKTKAELDAARETLRLYGLSDEVIEAVNPEPETPLSYFWLRSPLGGLVQRRDVAPGDSVGPMDTPFHVVNAHWLWLMIDAFERDASLLEAGQRVELTVRSLPARTFTGTLDWVSLQLDQETRTIRARAILENPDYLLRSGMFGTARVHVPETIDVPMVPVDAVQTVGGEKVVFVPGTVAGEYEPLPVRLGEELEGWVEVIGGLRPEQEVVTAGAFHLMSTLTAQRREAGH